jgi:hypothetical protein
MTAPLSWRPAGGVACCPMCGGPLERVGPLWICPAAGGLAVSLPWWRPPAAYLANGGTAP